MADQVKVDDYPIRLSALHLLAPHDAWLAERRAFNRWHEHAAGTRPDARAEAATRYWRGQAKLGGQLWIDLGGSTPKLVTVQRHFEDLDDLALCKRAALQAAEARITSGDVSMVVRKDEIDAEWFEVTLDRLENVKIVWRGNLIQFHQQGGASKSVTLYFARLRDLVGVPIDQAVWLYGDVPLVAQLVKLEQFGAPDRMGEMPDEASHGQPPVPLELRAAPATYRSLYADLVAGFHRRLCSGKLIASVSGAAIPWDFWPSVDISSPAELWHPGALVRSATEDEQNATRSASKTKPVKEKVKPGPKTSDNRLELLEIVKADIDKNGTPDREAIRKLLSRDTTSHAGLEKSKEDWFIRELKKSRQRKDDPKDALN